MPLRGFTLAEVLITLGIIGVVAALTIPTLMQNLNRRDTIAKVKKVHSVLSNAAQLSVQENGLPTTWGLEDRTNLQSTVVAIADKIKPFLKISKDCGTEVSACGSGCYSRVNDDSIVHCMHGNHVYKLILTDGTYLYFAGDSNQNHVTDFWLDVNGSKGPNKLGVDMFSYWWDIKTGLIKGLGPIDDPFTQNWNFTNYILFHDNMDYLDE